METYDKISDIAGITYDNNNSLIPPYHMTKKTDLCLTLDAEGKFLNAESNVQTIIIPCTEKSSARTSGIASYPLHDDLNYLAIDNEKKAIYLSNLEKWCSFNSKVSAVFKYVSKGTILDDLQSVDITINAKELDEEGNKKSDDRIKGEQDKINKLFVRFRVEVPDDTFPNLWEDTIIHKVWIDYCKASTSDGSLCYVTGELAELVYTHPKNINPATANAKLISSNDSTNYTYRGRFTDSKQANSIGGVASHKAHATLKFLISSHGYKCDTQAIVAWLVGDGTPAQDPFDNSFNIYSDSNRTDQEKLIEAQRIVGVEYQKVVRNALKGKGSVENLKNSEQRVPILAIDVATTGRMGITFYQDLEENEYIERLINWHTTCSWWFSNKGFSYISSPSTDKIISTVFGEDNGSSYKKIQKQARERVLHFIINGETIDKGWVNAAFVRVSNPFSYAKKGGGWDKFKWEEGVSVVCAITRKFFSDKNKNKEEYSLELEKTCNDRNYLFGRLLAIANRVENYARYLQTKGGVTDKRPTNAVRYLSVFMNKPMRTWKLIYEQLNPYIQRIPNSEWYQSQMDEIIELFDSDGFNDKPLDGRCLLGYSLQRRELAKKTSSTQNDEEEKIDEYNEEN